MIIVSQQLIRSLVSPLEFHPKMEIKRQQRKHRPALQSKWSLYSDIDTHREFMISNILCKLYIDFPENHITLPSLNLSSDFCKKFKLLLLTCLPVSCHFLLLSSHSLFFLPGSPLYKLQVTCKVKKTNKQTNIRVVCMGFLFFFSEAFFYLFLCSRNSVLIYCEGLVGL